MTIGLLDTLPVPPTIGWHLPPFLRGRLLQQFGNQGIIDIDTSNPRGPYTKDGPTELVSRFGFQPPNAYPGIITARIVSVRALKVQAEVLVPVRGQDMPVKVGLPPELLPAVKHSLCQKGT